MVSARVRLTRLVVAVLSVLAVTSGCGHPPDQSQVAGALTVLAPTSMTDVLPKLVFAFETEHTGVHLTVSFGPDARQATQPGDVLLAEGPSVLGGADATVFARNQLVLVVPAANPGHVIQLADLARPGLRVARCADAEPCGIATTALLTGSGITVAAPILVDDVRTARERVEQGSADVAVVYRSDGMTVPDRVATIEIPESAGAVTAYQALARPKPTNPGAAQSFVAFLTTAPAQNILTESGFQLP
jgi:molybdate transport system substrate-binding protein